jgi:hypothetical protein
VETVEELERVGVDVTSAIVCEIESLKLLFGTT